MAWRGAAAQAQDLADWRDSPEQFHHDSDVGCFQDNLRACAEALFLSLLERSRASVAPVVLSIAQTAGDAAPPGAAAQLIASGAPTTGAHLGRFGKALFLGGRLLAKHSAP